MKLKIGTINCQNNEENRSFKSNNSSLLAQHIIDNNYDIVGTQELTMNFTNRLFRNLKTIDKYNIYGGYQYGRGILGTRFPIIRTFNQANKILTKYPSIKTSTKSLPWIPSKWVDFKKGFKKKCITRRILTSIKINIEDENIYVINTHLDYYLYDVQKRQLEYLIDRIKLYQHDGKIILMGDFNLTTDEELFIDFIKKLESMGIKRVPVNDKTNASKYRQTSAIDHIFISNEFNIIDYGVYNIDNITDHKAVYANIEWN